MNHIIQCFNKTIECLPGCTQFLRYIILIGMLVPASSVSGVGKVVNLYEGRSVSIPLPVGARIVHVGSMEVAKASVKGQFVIISGIEVGITNVLMLASDGRTLGERELRVRSSASEVDAITSEMLGGSTTIRSSDVDGNHAFTTTAPDRESANILARSRLAYLNNRYDKKFDISVSDNTNIHLRVVVAEVDSHKLVNSVRNKFRINAQARLFALVVANPTVGIASLTANMEWGALRSLPGVKSLRDAELVFRNGESATMQMSFSGANIERSNLQAKRELTLEVAGEKNNKNSYNLHIRLNHNNLDTNAALEVQDRAKSVFESRFTVVGMQTTLIARVRSRDILIDAVDTKDNDNDVLLFATVINAGDGGTVANGDMRHVSRQLSTQLARRGIVTTGSQFIIFP